MGTWRRNDQRVWELLDFTVQSWEPLAPTSLPDAVTGMRTVLGSAWNQMADPQATLRAMREG